MKILVTGSPAIAAALAALSAECVEVIDATDPPRTRSIAEAFDNIQVVPTPTLRETPTQPGPQRIRKGKARRW